MPSFGEELRRERELRDITLREIAEATKINLRYLQALERNDFEHLPGGVFNKGFVRAYCDFIGVDSDTMVNAYLLEEQGQSTRETAPADVTARVATLPPTETSRSRAEPAARRGSPRRGRVVVWTVLVILGCVVLVGILVYLGRATFSARSAPHADDSRAGAPAADGKRGE